MFFALLCSNCLSTLVLLFVADIADIAIASAPVTCPC